MAARYNPRKPNPYPDIAFTFLGHYLTWVPTKRDGKADKTVYGAGPCWRWRSCRSPSNAIVVRAFPGGPHEKPQVLVSFFDGEEVDFNGRYNTSAEVGRLLERAAKLVIQRRNILVNAVGNEKW